MRVKASEYCKLGGLGQAPKKSKARVRINHDLQLWTSKVLEPYTWMECLKINLA